MGPMRRARRAGVRAIAAALAGLDLPALRAVARFASGPPEQGTSFMKARTHTKWLLHPSLPLDIRHLAVTLAAMGGVYAYTGSQDRSQAVWAPRKPHGVPLDDFPQVTRTPVPPTPAIATTPAPAPAPAPAALSKEGEGDGQAGAQEKDSEGQQGGGEVEVQGRWGEGAVAGQDGSGAGVGEGEAPSSAKEGAAEAGDESPAPEHAVVARVAPTEAEIDAVRQVWSEALLAHDGGGREAEAMRMSREGVEGAVGEVSKAGGAEEGSGDEDNASAQVADARAGEGAGAERGEDGTWGAGAGAEAEAARDAAIAALSRVRLPELEPEEPETRREADFAVEEMPPVPAHVRRVANRAARDVGAEARLRERAELSVQALVEAAKAKGVASRDDWRAFEVMMGQAESDREQFQQALEGISGALSTMVAERVAEVQWALQQRERMLADAARYIADLEDEYDRQRHEYRKFAKDLRSHLEAVATARVEEEAARAQLQWSERSLAERAEMARGVDALRAKTNALAEALQRRSDDQSYSHYVHRLSHASLALRASLEAGRSTRADVSALLLLAPTDPVIAALRPTLEDMAGARGGMATHAELMKELEMVGEEMRTLILLPSSSPAPGPLASWLGRVAASLRLGSATAGVEGALGRARASLARGRLAEAAREVEGAVEGTAAERVVRPWLSAVYARAAADQAMEMLTSHAAAMTASLQ